MGRTTRFFGPSSSGNGDGTTWGDRAALLVSGNWNTLIRSHNFNGADSLRCIIESASYVVPGLTFTSGNPSVANRLSFHAGTQSGLWTPPNVLWNCCQPLWDTAGMVTLTCTANITGIRHMDLYGLRLHNTGSATTLNYAYANWCEFLNSFASGSGYAGYGNELTNCVLQHTGTSFSAVLYPEMQTTLNNVRLVGNGSATSGNRFGIWANGHHFKVSKACIIGCLVGVVNSTGAISLGIDHCTFVNCPTAIQDRTNNATWHGQYTQNLIHNSTTGISLTDLTKTRTVIENIFNNVTNPDSGNGNWDTSNLNTISSLDAADLFVDPDNGDYRIKYGSPHWGKNIGAGDGPAPTPVTPSGPISSSRRIRQVVHNNI
jgi:hypothetical protein